MDSNFGPSTRFPSVRLAISLTYHLSLNREGRWGNTDDFATSFLHFPLFSTALCDLANSRPVHSLMLSYHLFLCLPRLTLPYHTIAKRARYLRGLTPPSIPTFSSSSSKRGVSDARFCQIVSPPPPLPSPA